MVLRESHSTPPASLLRRRAVASLLQRQPTQRSTMTATPTASPPPAPAASPPPAATLEPSTDPAPKTPAARSPDSIIDAGNESVDEEEPQHVDAETPRWLREAESVLAGAPPPSWIRWSSLVHLRGRTYRRAWQRWSAVVKRRRREDSHHHAAAQQREWAGTTRLALSWHRWRTRKAARESVALTTLGLQMAIAADARMRQRRAFQRWRSWWLHRLMNGAVFGALDDVAAAAARVAAQDKVRAHLQRWRDAAASATTTAVPAAAVTDASDDAPAYSPYVPFEEAAGSEEGSSDDETAPLDDPEVAAVAATAEAADVASTAPELDEEPLSPTTQQPPTPPPRSRQSVSTASDMASTAAGAAPRSRCRP